MPASRISVNCRTFEEAGEAVDRGASAVGVGAGVVVDDEEDCEGRLSAQYKGEHRD